MKVNVSCAKTGCEADRRRVADSRVVFKERIAMAESCLLIFSDHGIHIERSSPAVGVSIFRPDLIRRGSRSMIIRFS